MNGAPKPGYDKSLHRFRDRTKKGLRSEQSFNLLATRHRRTSALKLYMLYLSDGYKRCTQLAVCITEVLEIHMDNTCHAKDKTVFNREEST